MGGSLVGGLVGGNAGTVTNSYWNMTSSSLTTSAGGVGLTSAQMLLQSSFTGFDFTNTWRIYAGSTAPLLKAFLTPLTVSVSGSRAYNGLTDVSSLVVYSLTPSANLLGTAAANTASQNVGTYTVTPTGLYSNQFGYDISYAAASVNITAAPLAITANAHSKVYGSADPTLTYAITGGSLFNSDVLTGSLSRAAGETVVGGPYAIGQGTLGNGNYAITYTPDNLTITPAPLTFHATPSTMVYGGVVPSASYTVSGFVNSEVLGTSDVTGAPTLVITADSTSPVGGGYSVGIGTGTLASGNYSITVAGAGFSVTPAPLTVTMDALSKIYGNADPSLTYTITAGALLNGDTLSGTMTRVAGENVGNYAANGGLSNGNYTISYGGALAITPRGITLTANAQSKQYGTADLLLTYSIGGAGLATGDTAGAVFSGALARAAGETVAGGPYAINQGTLAANSNYAVTAFTPDNFTITTAPLSITASALSKIYGNADPTLTYSITAGALLNGDVLAGALSRAAGETVAGGPYAIGQGTLANGNYTITYTSNNFTITPRNITLAANAQSKQYGLADPLLTYTIGGLGLATGDTAGAVFSGALARAAGETVAGGPYAINPGTLAANSNYAVTAYAANDLTVTPAPLTVTMDALSKIYGNVDPSLTYTVTAGALLNGDTLSGTMTRVAGENVGSYAANGGLSNGNYTISYGGTLAITPRSISIAADASSKVYGNADALTYTVGGMGLAAWDTQATSFTGALGRAAGEAVAGGPYAINQGSLVAGGNYTVTGFTTANLTITPALLSVLANAGNKVEGDVDPLLSYMVAGLKLNDTAATTLGGALDRAVGETVGTYAINQGTLTLLSTNYTMSFTPSMFTIQAPIRITTAQVNNLFNTILPPAPPPSALPPSAASATPAQPDTQAQPDPQVPAEVNAVSPVAGETAAPRQLPVCQ
ncbi:MAG: MBG domain-containing protein [Gallionella sp.]|nr:MBG domain-containing protein [Gallionella sp.]